MYFHYIYLKLNYRCYHYIKLHLYMFIIQNYLILIIVAINYQFILYYYSTHYCIDLFLFIYNFIPFLLMESYQTLCNNQLKIYFLSTKIIFMISEPIQISNIYLGNSHLQFLLIKIMLLLKLLNHIFNQLHQII